MIKGISTLCILLVSILTFIGCSSKNTETPKTNISTLERAPDFEVTTIEGKRVSLKSTLDQGKPMVVYFTASWCPKCAQNWPQISKVYPEFKDRLDFVAISIDPSDSEEVMKKLSMEKDFTFPVTAGHPEIMLSFGVENQATTIGINRDGYIAFQKNYTTLSEDEYRTLFNEIVN